MIILEKKLKQYDKTINNDILEKVNKLAKNNFYGRLSISNREKGYFFLNNQHYTNTKNFKWFKYFFLKKPINLLFSLDQFLFEFSKKQPQKRRSSEFQQQLKEQKKITLFYGNLSKKELTKIIEKTKKYQGYFYRNFFSLLERRLDVVLYRCGFAKTISLARQLINHKKISINNKVITIPGYILQSGDCIGVQLRYTDSLSKNILVSIKTSLKKRRTHVKKQGLVPTPSGLDRKATKYYLFGTNVSQNFSKKFNNIKNNKKSYKTLNSLIHLLLKKIDSRAYIKIKQNSPLDLQSRDGAYIPSIYDITNLPKFGVKKHCCDTTNLGPNLNKYDNLDVCPNNLDACSNNLEMSSKYSKKFNNYLTLIKFKPLVSNQAKFLLFSLQENNYIFSDKKPLFIHSKNSFFFKEKQRKIINKQQYNNQNKKSYKKTNLFEKKNIVIYRNLLLKTFVLMNSHTIFKNFLIAGFKKHFNKKRFSFQNIKFLKFGGVKPLHLEISYNLLKAIFLYSPQRIKFPFYINIDLLSRAFK